MSRPGVRTRGNFAQDTLTAEFTTGQIVIMACGALAVACTMFALGVLVGRYDPTEPAVETAQESPAPETPPAPGGAPAVVVSEKPEPAVPAPVEEAKPADVAETAKPATAEQMNAEGKPVETVVASAPTMPTNTGTLNESVKPRVTRVEPLPLGPPGSSGAPRVTRVESLPGTTPAAAEPPKITPSEPVADKKPATPADDEPELMEAMPTQPAEAKPVQVAEAKPADVAKPTEPTKPTEPAKPVDDKKPANVGKPTGKYGIQVASFTGTAGASKAGDYAKRIKSTYGYEAGVSPSTDGKVYRVVIGGFGDKSAANEMCNELKEIAGFKDAFVKVL
jgi:cell division protein FtsN